MPQKIIKYLSEGEIIAVNEEMVAKYGGLHGVKDLNMLRLAIGRPQMSVGFQDAYKSIFDMPKFFGAILFLAYNGWSVEFKRREGVKFAMRVHNHDWTVEQISKWLKEHSLKTPR